MFGTRIDVIDDKQAMFLQMETSIKRCSHIVIHNMGRDEYLESCVNCFVGKYGRIIKRVVREYSSDGTYTTHIYARNLEKKHSRKYTDIQNEYDSEYYLEDCGGYKEFKESDGKIISDRLLQLLNQIDPKPGDNILDMGCGRGELTYALSTYGADVIGIDYSEDAIAICKKYFGETDEMLSGKLDYICGDVLELDESVKYNKIIMADIYEHIQADVMERLLDKITRLLGDDGVLYVHTAPNLDWYETEYPKLVSEAYKRKVFLPNNPRSRYEDMMHINEQSQDSLKNTLSRHFNNVIVWNGILTTTDKLDNREKYDVCIDLTAVASNDVDKEHLVRMVSYDALDRSSINVDISLRSKPQRLNDDTYTIQVYLKNRGSGCLKSQYPCPVFLSYHICSESGEILRFDNARISLGCIIHVGSSTEIPLVIRMDDFPVGKYMIEVDLVQEGVFWFKDITGNSEQFLLERE